MPVMQVGVMRVAMDERHVPMPGRVRFAGRHARPMLVLMVLVMNVAMFVLQRLVGVLMLVLFGEVEP